MLLTRLATGALCGAFVCSVSFHSMIQKMPVTQPCDPQSSAKELSAKVCWKALEGQGGQLRFPESGLSQQNWRLALRRHRQEEYWGRAGVMRPEAPPHKQPPVGEGPSRGYTQTSTPVSSKE